MIESMVMNDDGKRRIGGILAARQIPKNRTLLIQVAVEVEEGIRQPLLKRFGAAKAFSPFLELVDNLDLQRVRVLVRKKAGQFGADAFEQGLFLRHGLEGHQPVVIFFNYALRRVGKEATHMLHPPLLGSLAFHLWPD